MSWFIEHLHRDGSVLARVPLPKTEAGSNANGAQTLPPNPARSLRIGRALDNDLVLDDPHVAPYHARFEVNAGNEAHLHDLGTRNGIVNLRHKGRKRVTVHAVKNDEPYRLGQSLIRLRSADWPLVPERSLSQRAVWPWALFGLALVLSYGAYELWLNDVQEKSLPYLYSLAAEAFVMCLWSGMYALFGRLISGVDRFFSHLAIACTGYLAGTLILNFLQLLAVSMSWLWPVRITEVVVVLVVALTVRSHLRLADPKHWRALRVALGVVAGLAIVVPPAQLWISHHRLTDVQTIEAIKHPALRLARPVSVQQFSASAALLKARVDHARKHENNEDGEDEDNEGEGQD